MISEGSAENAFEDETYPQDTPRKDFVIPPPIPSTSIEESLVISGKTMKVNSIEDTKFLKSLISANRFLRKYIFPFDGERTLDIRRYKGNLDIITTQKIIEFTTYLSWTNIREGIRTLVTEFIEQMKNINIRSIEVNTHSETKQRKSRKQNFYLYIPDKEQISSELVLIIETWDLWYKFQPKGFFEKNSIAVNEEEITIVVVDDWSITGQSKVDMIDQITANNPTVKINFHFLIPYMSQISRRMLDIFSNVKFSTINDKWDIYHIAFNDDFCSRNKKEINSEILYLIYSDLKIPDIHSCPKRFYTQCISNPPFNVKFVLETFLTESKATPM